MAYSGYPEDPHIPVLYMNSRLSLKIPESLNPEYMVVSLSYCSQNGGNIYRALYYNGNPNIGPRIIGNLDQYPYAPLKPAACPLRQLWLLFALHRCLGFHRWLWGSVSSSRVSGSRLWV